MGICRQSEETMTTHAEAALAKCRYTCRAVPAAEEKDNPAGQRFELLPAAEMMMNGDGLRY